MRRIHIIAVLILIAGSSAYAGWWRTYGDEGYNCNAYCVLQTDDGGYIISGDPWQLMKVDKKGAIEWKTDRGYPAKGWGGYCVDKTDGGGYITCGHQPVSNYSWFYMLAKYNGVGDTQWTRRWGGGGWSPRWIEQTCDGGYIVTGSIVCIDEFEPWSVITLCKTDNEGNIVWEKFYGLQYADQFSYGHCVQQTTDGGYIVSGVTWLELLWLIKTDSMGNTMWEIKGNGDVPLELGVGRFVRQTTDGGYIVVGNMYFANHDESIYLLRTDSLGNILWTKYFGDETYGDDARCVQQTIDGGYIITGYNRSLKMNNDLWLIKTDFLGDTLWTRTYGGEGSDVGNSVQQTGDGGYIVAGSTTSFGAGESDIYLLKTDSLGLLGISEPPPVTPVTHLEILSSIGLSITMRYSNCQGGFRALVYDAGGRRVDEIIAPNQSGVLVWGTRQNPGIYFIRVDLGAMPAAQKIVIIK